MALTFDTARQLFKAGRYAEIVAHNTSDHELSALPAEYRVFLAHAMFQAGQIGRAREIGDMHLEVQPKLLRFLESNEVHPIGGTQPVRVDVRVIAATNAHLDALVSDGRFREDLFYRLNIVHLPIPPLRERRIEIPALANHYLEKYALEYGTGNLRLAEETMEYLTLYRWPGNVRQLANEMRRMAALCETGAVIMPEHLSPAIAASRRTIPASERTLDPTEVVVRLDQPLAAAARRAA